MALRDHFARLHMALRLRAGKRANPYFAFDEQKIAATDTKHWLEQSTGDLERIILTHKGRLVHKWLHFPKIYEREFAAYRGSDVNFIELGVFKGGSLEIWRKYFGANAQVTGIDINAECADFVDPPNRVFIGSQADPAFLRSILEETGAPDIILDDASHVARHQRISFETLFPLLKVDGLYVIEDLHTAYWPGFYEGGYRRKGTAIELAKSLVDDMHGWYHNHGCVAAQTPSVASVRFYDSIVVIEKGNATKPAHIQVGTKVGIKQT